MAQGMAWSVWIDEPPFQFRFRSTWLNYDGDNGPGTKASYCGLKSIDFALMAPDNLESGLYLLEVKSSERFNSGNDQLDDKICNLFRCYFDSLAVLARSNDNEVSGFREAAKNDRVKLVLFTSPRLLESDHLMGEMDSIRRRLANKLRPLDIEPEILIETLETVKRTEHLLFDARRA